MNKNNDFAENQKTVDFTTKKTEWVTKLRYTRSFLAKLYLSKVEIKEYYCALLNTFISREGVTVKTTFKGVSFSAKHKILAKATISGKTLIVFFAADPAEYLNGRYKAIDVSGVFSYARVPAKFRIRSKGALSFVLRVANKVADEADLATKKIPVVPVTPKDFPADSFENLLSRGLIREIGRKTETPIINEVAGEKNVAYVEKNVPMGTDTEEPIAEAYEDTLVSGFKLIDRHNEYTDLMGSFLGDEDIRFVKQTIIRAVDEKWVEAIENCLPALDEVTRNPSHFIEETEELLPIERTKKVTTRSIKHLCQHTGLISRIEGDMVIPSKLLNVFRDESVMTYENKFVNTLLLRLFDFVTMRYEEAEEFGANRRKFVFSYTDKIEQGEEQGKTTVTTEIVAPSEEKEKTRFFQSDLWARVKKLNEVITDYRGSEFATQMGNVSIRPPVVRTNAILKNKNLRQCLELWEFLEEYDESEAGVTTSEEEIFVSDEQKETAKRLLAQQYLVLKHFADLALTQEKIEKEKSDLTEKAKNKDKNGLAERKITQEIENAEEKSELAFWVDVALRAEEIACQEGMSIAEQAQREREELLQEVEEEKEKIVSAVDDLPVQYPEYSFKNETTEQTDEDQADEREDEKDDEQEDERAEVEENGERVVYVKSFAAKLALADERLKEYYCALANELLSKEGVKERRAFDHVDYYHGKRTLARFMLVGKTLRVYFPIATETLDEKYNAVDRSEIKKYASLPSMIRVRGPRGMKHASEIIEMVCEGLNEKIVSSPLNTNAFPSKSMEEFIASGEIRRRVLSIIAEKPRENGEKADLGINDRFIRSARRPIEEKHIDYSAEAAEYNKERENGGKEIVLDSVSPTEIVGVLKKVDEEEREKMPKAEEKTPLDGAAGDPLYWREEAIPTNMTIAEELEKPVEKVVEKPKVVSPDGDVLTPKPITADAIGVSGTNKRQQVPVKQTEKVVEKKKESVWTRLFGRKDKR